MVDSPKLLSIEELRKELPQFWTIIENSDIPKIQRIYNFNRYMDCLAMVNRLAELANEMDHHPDILLTYGAVKVEIFTHSLKGVSTFDLQYAKFAEKLFASMP
ncbi:4a-hydroxytetrahydrobiopterin dehydratase [Leptospira langatensis]|uniref:4a-hydroxytetrahydrobiopterin dehydratase n=1 Tax=Leptospira langatensis TaxID=2484983 RepID=A0A5F1ZPF5_9LEPT|nr:4a-hydroxytetrahydrobiopterin dehydratase [Leptospira langatensis]TGK01753.1 4a-hydroxytetrahydrobiopterin dehydratase [Leptospira langatensis]TGL39359.1 4a-hydroxytetrahydrobiopterin dehydratase [Leptospira langatensis]